MPSYYSGISIGVVDPGFPRGGGTNPGGDGEATHDFAKFSKKLHEFKEVWATANALYT